MTIREGWLARRNALLMNPRFHRWAARFPLTRFVARRRARGLFDIVAGFVYSQVASACVRLELLEMLAGGPLDTRTVAARTALSEDMALTLLRAAASLQLVEALPDNRFVLGIHGAALLGSPGVAAMIRHHDRLYADLADPVALLRRSGGGGQLAALWPYAAGATDPQAAADYSALMAASQPMVAAQVLAACDFRRYSRLLDIGGGEGAFVRAVAAHHSTLGLTLFDLPDVAARARIALADLGNRITIVEGSFRSDPLPRGADVITLVRILHDHDDATVQALLSAVAQALPRQGTLIVAEPMAGVAGAEPIGHAYFGLYLLAMGSGRPRTAGEIGAMLTAAGFAGWRQVPTAMPLVASVLVARR